MITHVETVAVYVSDQDRAVDFFVDQLGFELRKDVRIGAAEDAPPLDRGGPARSQDRARPLHASWTRRSNRELVQSGVPV